MMDTTLGYLLCCQSPTLFLAAVVLLLCYFARRRSHHAHAVLDLVLCIVCAAAGVTLYFFGMGRGYFTIRDFYVIRTPAWVGMAVVAVIAVWVAVRAFLAANRRRIAEKESNRAANAEAHQRQEAEKAEAKLRDAREKAANAAAVTHVSETVSDMLTEEAAPAADADAAASDPAVPAALTPKE